MANHIPCLSHKLIYTFAEKTDKDGRFIPYSIRAITKEGELIEHNEVVHVPVRKGDVQAIRRQRRGIRRFKILSSGEIREVYECLIIEINGTRFLTSINGRVNG